MGITHNLPGGPRKYDDDEMSEFSVGTVHSDLRPEENVMDLKLTNLELNE